MSSAETLFFISYCCCNKLTTYLVAKKNTHIYYFTILEVRSQNRSDQTKIKMLADVFPSRGQLLPLSFPAVSGHLYCLVGGPSPPSSKSCHLIFFPWSHLPQALSSALSSLFKDPCECTDFPGKFRIIFLFYSQLISNLKSICTFNSHLPWKVTYSQAPELKMWTYLMPLFSLQQTRFLR